jgi:alkanesulfonate monooxygenase SsuD/methylene tetrahydromethanopterin reductase-like flavin-dependent oxidoreductase (luciferase family)
MTTPASVRARGDHCRYGPLTGSWPLGMPPDGGFYRRLAADVERHGFDFLFDGDHLFMHNPNPGPLAILGTYAGATERVVLGTGVLLAALRAPVVIAKQLATIDYVSGGHLIVGVDVGGEVEQEWRAMEIPREQRGARTDEALALLRAFWSTEELAFDGQFRHVHGVTSSPESATTGGPPIWVGRRSDKALARAARDDGWCAYNASTSRGATGSTPSPACATTTWNEYRISYAIFTYVSDSHEHDRTMAGQVLGKRYSQEFDHFLDAFRAVGTPDHVAEQFRSSATPSAPTSANTGFQSSCAVAGRAR